jgi:di/tricarboxylate transporter
MSKSTFGCFGHSAKGGHDMMNSDPSMGKLTFSQGVFAILVSFICFPLALLYIYTTKMRNAEKEHNAQIDKMPRFSRFYPPPNPRTRVR